MANPNKQPLGERAKGSKKVRCLTDIYGPSKDAQDFLKATREAFNDKEEGDGLPNQDWSQFDKVDDGYPNLLAPYDKEKVQALDQAELDPMSQVEFCCTFYWWHALEPEL